MATLTMHHVHKTYPNGHVAVPDLTLDVGDGEFLVLVGPSGCGKSTVLRMIAGLEEVTTGELRIEGRVVNSMEPRERDIAMVFQSYALYPTMTVAENIAFAMRLRKTDKRVMAAKVAEVAELLELTPVLDRKPGQLSGGQRQRVAMGRAIVREPKLFLMDEPLSNLDAQLRVQTRAEISKIQRRLGVTTVYVTHDQVEAMTMGDRVAVLRRGELMQCATPGELYGAPANLFVAQFIGSPSMNVLRATVSAADDGAITLAVGEQQLHVDGAAAARLAPLRAMVGRDVAIGLRPEALGDDGAASLDVEVDLVEVLGSSQLAHCTLAAAPVRAADEGVAVGDAPATIVAALDPRAQVRAGERRTLAVDVLRLHVFDLATGDAIAGS